MKRLIIALTLLIAASAASCVGVATADFTNSMRPTLSAITPEFKAAVEAPSCDPLSIKRDKHGKVARSQKSIREFKKYYPCPDTLQTDGHCQGFKIDHIRPLCYCGPDDWRNMQWQDNKSAALKDRYEKIMCRGLTDDSKVVKHVSN